MAESIFLEPIRKWFASRSAKKQIDEVLPLTTLTPEQQFAHLRGLPVEVPGHTDTRSTGPGEGQPSPGLPLAPTIDNAVACRQCRQGCAPDAVFCPFCATVLVPPMAAAANTPGFQVPSARCAQCGQECPEGYDLCANCTTLNPQPELEDESTPTIKRVSIGNGGSETSPEDQQPSVSVQVQPVNPDSDDDGEESPNVTMAESLRNIFSGQSAINPDTVAFLERYGTTGTNELLDELRSLHRALR
jgi:hypothetical protein